MDKTALVIGLGLSGKAACRFLQRQGYVVTGVDKKRACVEESRSLGVEVLLDTSLQEDRVFSLVVPSPGVPSANQCLENAIKRGAVLVSEVELALQGFQGRAVAVTGTNGKTTVTLLVEHVLRASGKKARALGNIGIPLTEYFLEPDPEEILVVELSSYQLQGLGSRVFDAAVILNITPDHLDRHTTMEEYAKAKANVAFCLKEGGELFLHEPVVMEYGHLFTSPYSILDLQADIDRDFGQKKDHNQSNILAALALCQKMGVSQEAFFLALESFKKPAHRIEWIKDIDGVSYYDDSKGTNIDAVIQAVNSMEGPVILIAGGVDKGASYMPWKKSFEGRVKKMFLLGEAAEKIASELALFFNVKIVDSLEEAVRESAGVAVRGDKVLLSPGCSSFDMFRDYAHRGFEFQKFVGLLEEKQP